LINLRVFLSLQQETCRFLW